MASGHIDLTGLVCGQEAVKDLTVVGSIDDIGNVWAVLLDGDDRDVAPRDQSSDSLSGLDLVKFGHWVPSVRPFSRMLVAALKMLRHRS